MQLAARFAHERTSPAGPTFGIHGLFNTQDALTRLLHDLPDEMARGLDAHDLCASLIRHVRLDDARLLNDKRRRLGMRDRRTLRLELRLAWVRWLAPRRPSHTAPHD